MLNKNAVIILKCIMDRDKCDMESAIWFVKHNQTCYEITRAVANAKDEDAKAEKQALIDKACEWLSNNIEYYTDTQNDSEGNLCEVILEDALIRDFRNAMKGGNYENN